MKQLVELLQNRRNDVDDWILSHWRDKTPPVYLSGDLRHSGHKMAVIDSNMFPAGFNNLCTVFSKDVSNAFSDYFKKYYPQAKQLLLLIEEHTRNKYYLKNVLRLKELLEAASLKVTVGVLGETINEEHLNLEFDESKIDIYKIKKENNSITANGQSMDLILSNNDFSSGPPTLLDECKTEMIPAAHFGWFNRKKSTHFERLWEVCASFGRQFNIDPWIFCAMSKRSGVIDFDSEGTIDGLAKEVEILIAAIQDKYDQYGIKDSPYVYLKNNSGTYGMGLLPVFSGDEVLSLNRRKKNKLLSSKGGQNVTEFILQEGIPTIDSYSGFPIEPVIYNVGGRDIGGFFRIHESKNELESLNAPGMTFSCLCLHKLDEPHEKFFIECREKERLILVARFLSRLDALAVTRENT